MIRIELRTVPGLNARELWQARSSRVKKERKATAKALKGQGRPPIPCSVRLTRIAPSAGVDDDNLSGSLKGVRDEVAAWLGVDDRKHLQVRYVYDQKTGPWGVTIEWGEPVAGAQFELLPYEFISMPTAPRETRKNRKSEGETFGAEVLFT